jgi:tetratricopeptide (TPR) repeat protein
MTKKVWSIICAIVVITGLLGYVGIQPYWTKIDPEALAKQLAKHFPSQQDFAAKEEEIKELKATIERLQKDPADKFKQEALQALKENDTKKAVELMEKSAQSRTVKAAQDWIDIGNIAYLNDSQKALNAYEKATRLDPSNPDAWNRLGHIQVRLGLLDKAQHAFEKVLELAGQDKEFQARAYGNLGIIYEIREQLDRAEEFYLKSFDINKTLGNKEVMAKLFNNFGNVYKTRGDLDKAEEFYLKSFDINKKLGRLDGMASVYGNLGNIYNSRGKLDKAEEFYWKVLELEKTLGRPESMAIAYANLGLIYQRREVLDKACGYWQQSLQLFTDIGAQDKIDQVNQLITKNCREKE